MTPAAALEFREIVTGRAAAERRQAQQGTRPVAPDESAAVLAAAHDDELELVRHFVRVMTIWAPAFLQLLVAEQGPRAEPFAELAHQLFDDVPAGFLPLVILSLVVSLHAHRTSKADLAELLALLEPDVVDLVLLRELPESARRDAFDRLPGDRKERVVVGLRVAAIRRRAVSR